jgi:SAM-dependent methyltransferase
LSKLAEANYLRLTGEDGRIHTSGKPFTDSYCGVNLASIGTIMTLLPEPPARILDMGRGAGWTSFFFAKRGYEVVGQNICQDAIDLANENVDYQGPGLRVSFTCSDYESTTFADEFDAVVFYDCLHHAEDERAALVSAHRALRPGGVLITHEPGEGHSTAPASIEAMRLYGVAERDMPPRLILQHGRELGFASSRVYPMQHELIEIFYRDSIPRLFSKKAFLRAKRILKAAFRPPEGASSIVTLVK